MFWYIVIGIIVLVLFVPQLLADRSPIPETSGNVHKIKDVEELNTVLKSNTHVIVDAYADWCPPCRAIAPVFSQLADANATPGKLAFAKVNVDHVKSVAVMYGVTAMPSFIPFKNGKPAPVAMDNVKSSRSVIRSDDGHVNRILGADVMSLKALVAAMKAQAT